MELGSGIFVHFYTYLHITRHQIRSSKFFLLTDFHLLLLGYSLFSVYVPSVSYVYYYSIFFVVESHCDFIYSQFNCFVQNNNTLILTINSTIANLSLFTSEPSLYYNYSIFNGWFGIPFQDSLHATYITAPRSSAILALCNLSFHTLPYSSLILSKHIQYFVLHTLPSCLYKHIASLFLSKILSSSILLAIFHQRISSYFTLCLPSTTQSHRIFLR